MMTLIILSIKEALSYDIADEYVTYTELSDIHSWCLKNGVNEIGENQQGFISSMTHPENSLSKAVENEIDAVTCLIANKLAILPDDEFLDFAIHHYDEDFNFHEEAINLDLIAS